MTEQAYRVLARKYRPQRFAELIGQAAMVKTLENAIASQRLAHAFILTGVRGVGKTTTARLIARALNCVGKDGSGGPTIDPCGVCEFCVTIAASRAADVIEMDAASHTGVNDIRAIIDSAPYAAAAARYKIYIIDEVHMLSTSAFNALLKTLEEPPAHVKFIFATTEIRKVPVTVLSRCQRFDLKRIEAAELVGHFARVLDAEGLAADDEALALIARAADGSVRDGLSLLDQAIAHGGGTVEGPAVRAMIGLADRGRMIALYRHLMAGKVAEALEILREQYRAGADPLVVVEDLLDLTHFVTKAKLAPELLDQPGLAAIEREAASELSVLSMAALTRNWQILLKGLEEIRSAPGPLAAAEMVLIRLSHASELPSPADLIKKLQAKPALASVAPSTPPSPGSSGSPTASRGATVMALHPQSIAQPTAFANPQSFPAVVDLFEARKEGILGTALRDDVRLIRFAQGVIELCPGPRAPRGLAGRVMTCLEAWTGSPWRVVMSQDDQGGEVSLREQEEERDRQLRAVAQAHPDVRRVLDAFPGAELVTVRARDEVASDQEPVGDFPFDDEID